PFMTDRQVELKPPLAEGSVMAMDDIAHECGPGDRLATDLEPAGLNSGDIQELEDETRHPVDLVEGDVEILLGCAQVVFADEGLGKLRVALDRGDRRTQLV